MGFDFGLGLDFGNGFLDLALAPLGLDEDDVTDALNDLALGFTRRRTGDDFPQENGPTLHGILIFGLLSRKFKQIKYIFTMF